jgi:two-component system LytT family response regulator
MTRHSAETADQLTWFLKADANVTPTHPTVLDPSPVAAPRLAHVSVKSGGVPLTISTAEIDWWETEGNYMRLHTAGASYLIRATAANLEQQLDPTQFLRIHRRFIVNVNRIVEVLPSFAGDGIVILRNGTRLRLSRTHRDGLLHRLDPKPLLTSVAAGSR